MFTSMEYDMVQLKELPTSILKNTFGYGYFSLLSPLLIGDNKRERKYFHKSWKYQKFIVAILQAVIIIRCCFVLWETLQTKEQVKFWTNVVAVLVWQTYLYSAIFVLWFKQEKILLLVNQLRGLCIRMSQNNLLRLHKTLVLALKILVPAFIFAHAVALFISPQVFSPKKCVSNTKNVSLKEEDTSSGEAAGAKAFIYLYVFPMAVTIIDYFLVATIAFGYYIMLGLSAAFWLTIEGFVRGMQNGVPTAQDVEVVLVIMADMSRTFDTCSEAFGLLFAHSLALVLGFAIQFHQLFQNETAYQIEFGVNSSLFLSILVLAASCNSQITSVQTWIYQSITTHCNPISQPTEQRLHFRISLLMNEISEKQFGIRGIFFTVTYGFIGTVCGLVITYALVVSQLQKTTE